LTVHVPPGYEVDAFTCPYCGAFATQDWFDFTLPAPWREAKFFKGWKWSLCLHCKVLAIWSHRKKMVQPAAGGGPEANPDMPQAVLEIYDEARAVRDISPRSCGALLRLALQLLIDELEPGTGSINQKIGRLVERGLDPTVQKAMDVLRVVGNNAVHPGSVSLDEDTELIPALFEMLNLIVENVVSRPRQVQLLFENLPEGARVAIQQRDGT
jgi:hypothetical protein